MSSFGESSQTEVARSDEPMLSQGLVTERQSETYSNRLRKYAWRGKCAWTTFVTLTVVLLLLLVCGAVALLIRSDKVEPVYKATKPASEPEQQKQTQVEEPKQLKIEFESSPGVKQEILISVQDNYTELLSQDLTVYNHFKKRVSLLRVEVSPGVQVCLVKIIEKEVQPDQLQDALADIQSIKVNATELYVIEDSPVPEAIKEDMAVYQYCSDAKLYLLKKVDPLGPDVGMTMEQLIQRFEEDQRKSYGRYARQATSNPSDKHNGGPYHCGGPLDGKGELMLAKEYTCTKKKNFCYSSLVNERCDECYHGHNLRSRGCWCPINAIQTCIRISHKPVKRTCCGVGVHPCIQSECGTKRIPFLPIPDVQIHIFTSRPPK